MYEIHPSIPRRINLVEYWTKKSGFTLPKTQKWIRRRDLKVSTHEGKYGITFLKKINVNFSYTKGARLIAQTLPVGQYITKMTPKVDKHDEFEIQGMFADVWFDLQVNQFLKILHYHIVYL